MKLYMYESCQGAIYFTAHEQIFDDLYCETCGDSDDFLGVVNSKEDVIYLLTHLADGLDEEYAFLNYDPNSKEVKKVVERYEAIQENSKNS